jgi:hypothetical protein
MRLESLFRFLAQSFCYIDLMLNHNNQAKNILLYKTESFLLKNSLAEEKLSCHKIVNISY